MRLFPFSFLDAQGKTWDSTSNTYVYPYGLHVGIHPPSLVLFPTLVYILFLVWIFFYPSHTYTISSCYNFIGCSLKSFVKFVFFYPN